MSNKPTLSQLLADRVASNIIGDRRKSEPRRMHIEPLEARILFSGSPAPAPEAAPEPEAAPAPAVETVELAAEAPVPAADVDVADDSIPTVSTVPDATEQGAIDVDGTGAGVVIDGTGTELEGESAPEVESAIGDVELAAVAEAAAQRWIESGITGEQAEALASLTYAVADLAGPALGEFNNGHISLDADAAGQGWFIDTTPFDNGEFEVVLNSEKLLAGSGDMPAQSGLKRL